MDFLVSVTGRNPAFSYWLAILIFTIVVRLLLWPLSKAQYESSQKMMALQPRMKELQQKYKDKPEELNRRVLQLYKEAGVNPFGCGFNMFVQMGILIILYGIIRDYQFQFQNGHFLWIGSSLSRQYPQFLAPNLAMPDKPLLLLYAVSMFLSQKLTMIPNPDPAQQQSQQMIAIMMPLMFLFILQTFPSAFTLYWLLFNIFTTVQQLLIMKKFRSGQALVTVSSAPPDPPKSVKPRPSKPRRRGG
jgi:YidC/Oxa1 family membrane protein insertase